MSVRLASICTNTHTRRHAHLFLHVLLAWQLWAFRRDCWHLGVASCLLAGTKAAHALLFFHSRKSVIVERESGKGVSRASLRRLLPVRSFCSRSEAFALAQKLLLSLRSLLSQELARCLWIRRNRELPNQLAYYSPRSISGKMCVGCRPRRPMRRPHSPTCSSF